MLAGVARSEALSGGGVAVGDDGVRSVGVRGDAVVLVDEDGT